MYRSAETVYTETMARKAVPLRLEPELIAEIDAAAKAIDTNRTYFIEDAIKARLHLAKSYVAMDKGPPKTVKSAARGAAHGRARPMPFRCGQRRICLARRRR